MSRARRFASLRSLLPLALLCSSVAVAGSHGHGGGRDSGRDGGRDSGRGHSVSVEALSFDVTLSDGATYQIAATWYHRGSSKNTPLQVVVHGATYDHRYWDAPEINGEDYSYADYMVDQGYAVLAIDQLGAGESDQPYGYFLTLDETASGLHQVLASLRGRGNPTGVAYEQIALVGHSNGALTAIYEESVYGSADALVTLGWGHTATELGLDEAWLGSLLANPYVPETAFPEALRAPLFYYAPMADPDMITYDAENLASTMSAGQLYDLLVAMTWRTVDGAADVTGPVYVQLGDCDPVAPGAYSGLEASFWASASSVDVEVVSDMGHDSNLHLNREQSWEGVVSWLDDTLPGGCDR